MHYLLINESSLSGKRWYRRVDDQCADTSGDSNKCRLQQVCGKYIARIKNIHGGCGGKKGVEELTTKEQRNPWKAIRLSLVDMDTNSCLTEAGEMKMNY